MARSPQSRFIEGSMNDRTSNAPPQNYIGSNAEGTAEYDRQFALDWKPPEPNFQRPPNRNSFISVGSPTSMTSSRSTWSKGYKTPGSSTSGFLVPLWGGVKERFNVHRSKSSNTVVSENSNSDDGHSGLLVPPIFKKKRSESTDTANMFRAKNSSRKLDKNSPNRGSETPKLKKTPSAATLPTGGVNCSTGFDPTKRPTREEIQANYQSLLASGFFGNRAIQSTRFSPPGQNQNRSYLPASPSIAHHLSDDGQEQQEHEDLSPTPTPTPPPPHRQPPPPPSRIAPTPPDLPTDNKSASPSSAGIPVSETAVFNPVSPEPQNSRDMPPPLSPPKQKKSGHRPSLSFSSLFSSSSRPKNEPSVSRPFRSPQPSVARFSLDSGWQSFDVQSNEDPDQQKGLKRSYKATNWSDVSLASRRYYDVGSPVDGEKGTTRAEEGGRESGARKLVKKLRTSASRLSMDLGKTISSMDLGRTVSRPASLFGAESDVKGSGWMSPPRQPLSAAIKNTFSWRLGKSEPEATTTTDPNRNHDSSNSNKSGNKIRTGIRGNGTTGAAPEAKTPRRFLPQSLSVITGSPTSPERNQPKKKEMHGRRLRRRSSIKFPSKATYEPSELDPTGDSNATMEHTTDLQPSLTRPSAGGHRSQSRSRSRSGPRRSSTTMFTHNQSRPGTADSTESFLSSTSNANYNHQHQHHHGHVAPASPYDPSTQPRRSAEVNQTTVTGTDYMDGIESMMPSFHFPGRVRPGVPLAVVPDANRGVPSMPGMPGEYRGVKVSNGRGENVDRGGGVWPSRQAWF